MKLVDLNPEYGAVDAERLPGRFWLTFDCRNTKGCRVYVQFHRAAPESGVWQCTSRWRVVPHLEHLGELPDIECLTLVPSIGDHAAGRSIRCPGHVNIAEGQVLP